MTLWDRFLGLVFAAAYALRRAKIGFVRLDAAAIAASVLAAALTVYRGWVQGWDWWHAAVALGCLAVGGLILWADARRYVVFRETDDALPIGAVELAAEQKIFVKGSGQFEVSDMRRYLAEVPVVFWTTELSDHILAAKVRAPSVLGVGVPKGERGWWYMFLNPATVREIVAGELCFGLRCRRAIRVQYDSEKGAEALYISCDGVEQHQTLLGELMAKVDAARAKQGLASEEPSV